MANISITDVLDSVSKDGPFDLFTVNDIQKTFEKVVPLRYNQNVPLQGTGILLMPYAAGHNLGGAIWRLRKENDDIVYAVHYNHKKEANALRIQTNRKQRDKELTDAVMHTLRNNGNVLIPVDSCSRSLELLYFLDTFWEQNRIGTYPLIYLTNQTQKTIDYAKSMIEWMGDSVKKRFESTRENPFDFRYLRTISKLEDIKKYGACKVILASLPSLNSGFARQLFLEWAKDPKNCVIFTSDFQTNSLSHKLLKDKTLTQVRIQFQKQVPLEGKEKAEYLKAEQEKKERENAEEALAAYRKSREEESDEEELDQDEETERKRLRMIQMQHELYWTMTQFDLFVKDPNIKSSGLHKQSYDMFPMFDKKLKFDDYGEIIRIEDYKKEEKEIDMMETDLPAEKQEKNENIPKKWVPIDELLSIQCRRLFIDFEGLSDGKSIKNILSRVSPKKLIFVHGSEESTNHLAQYFRFSPDITNDIFTPSVMNNVNVSSSINIYQLKLTDALLSSLHFEKFGDSQLSFITGLVRYQEEAEEEAKVPTLDVVSEVTGFTRRPVFVGDAKLSEFRKLCNQNGIQTDFYAGDLVCEESVIVRKNHEGQLTIEGALGETYFKVRDLLYGQHAIL